VEKLGHKSPSCREKNKPKEEWAINKAQQSHAQAKATISDMSAVTSVTSSNNPPSSQASNLNQNGWAGAHVNFQFYQTSNMRDWILLDNQSSVTVFYNPKMVETFECLPTEACTWPQMVDPWSLI
jgi:hypothetical protein